MKSFLALAFVSAVFAACTSKSLDSNRADSMPPQPWSVLVSPSARYEGSALSQLSANVGNEIRNLSFTFSVPIDMTMQPERSFGVSALLPMDIRIAQAITLNVVATGAPQEAGFASIYAGGIDRAPDFSSATVILTFGQGSFTGEIILGGGSPNWTLQGYFYVTCSVPPSELTAPPTSGIVDASSESLVEDVKLETARCQPYRPFSRP